MFSLLVNISIGQQVSLTGKVINPDEKPVKKVLVYLANNPSIYCYSDSLGIFSLTEISTSVTEVRQDNIISFENRKLSVYANNQSISVDVFTIDGRQVKNVVSLRYCLGTFGLYPEAYLSDLPKAVYIVRVIVGNTSQSFRIQNIIPSGFPQGITEYDINNIIDNSSTELKTEFNIETKSGVLDTLVLVHDFYKSREIPLDSYSIQYDTIHLNNFADYSIAEGFESSVTYWHNGYANFTNIFSTDSVQFIIDYDSLSILNGDLKVITIPVDKIEGLDNSIEFISGLHFEPSGTRFFQSAQVYLSMKDPIPEGLVVFHYNDQGETYFIPHKDLNSRSITFYINHFSSIGIGTGEVPPPSDNPEEFTTSDQFISYLAKKYINNEEVPEEFFETWYNNIIAPMVSNSSDLKGLMDALNEFLTIRRAFDILGLDDPPFLGGAIDEINEKMKQIWDGLIVQYNKLNDNCSKRGILNKALNMIKLSDIVGDLLFNPDIHDFGTGEMYDLPTEIVFPTQVKDLEPDSSYLVEYTLKCLSDNCITEKVAWFSSDPSVATIDDEGLITALKKGITVIKAQICDVENTFKLEVGYNCEEYYCRNEDDSCYSGIYHCSGITTHTTKGQHLECGPWQDEYITYYTMVGELGNKPGYWIENTIHNVENKPSINGCQNYFKLDYDRIYVKGAFHCQGTNSFMYWPYASFPTNEGHFSGDVLIFDVRYPSGDEGYKTTKFFCNRIDK